MITLTELSSLARFTTPELERVLARRQGARRELAAQGLTAADPAYRAALASVRAVVETLALR